MQITDILGLKRDDGLDDYDVEIFGFNWDILNDNPGVLITDDISTVTGWASNREGRHVFDKTSGLTWRWDGAAFVRAFALGKLDTNVRTTPITTTVVAPSFAVGISRAVTVPEGGRDIEIVCEIPSAYATMGVIDLAVFRGSTVIQNWQQTGDATTTMAGDERGAPFSMIDVAPAAGAETYSIQFAVADGYTGTATLAASSFAPLRITILEV